MLTNPATQTSLQVMRPGLAGGDHSGRSSDDGGTKDRSVLLDIEDAVRHGGPSPHAAIAAILEHAVGEPGFLRGLRFAGSPERYTRHLIYAGPGFSLLAVVWLPGQMSPIHAHRSWCALAVWRGSLVETCFTPDASAALPKPALQLDACRQLRPGMVSHSDGDEEHYHRIANLGVEAAISIHAYGVAYDRLGHDLNRMWEE